MNMRTVILSAALLGLAGCATPHQTTPGPVSGERRFGRDITVAWELRYYVIGARSPHAGLVLLSAPDEVRKTQVDGFLMEIVEPPQYAGQILMAHFDAAGVADPFVFYKLGRRYTEQVPEQAIGRMFPPLCR